MEGHLGVNFPNTEHWTRTTQLIFIGLQDKFVFDWFFLIMQIYFMRTRVGLIEILGLLIYHFWKKKSGSRYRIIVFEFKDVIS